MNYFNVAKACLYVLGFTYFVLDSDMFMIKVHTKFLRYLHVRVEWFVFSNQYDIYLCLNED